MDKQEVVSIFNYTDYRRFIQELSIERKQVDPSFSFRSLAREVGYNSPGFIKELIEGKRVLIQPFTLRLAKAMKLTRKEIEYFEDMVNFVQAREPEEREYYYDKMIRAFNTKIYRMKSDQYTYYSRWYYSAIREFLFIQNFSGDYQGLAAHLAPPITPAMAKEAIALMLRLKLIKRNEKGIYKPTDTLITTGAEVQSIHAAAFHRSMMALAGESLNRHPKESRDVSGVTVSIDKETFDAIKSECVFFRKRILNLAAKEKNLDRVYQVNIQLFPLTSPLKNGGNN
ncbi:MAG: hypothetical protein A2293_14150 [Elusimicrobia bacterium RIFOXYB2_FULL_49_7]|nr:MAG: hypothetical protein A2293_14150 [Elusimicrobia bacterium RIFOXYB2_FULL_49_7]